MEFHYLKEVRNDIECDLLILGVFEGKENSGVILKMNKILDGHLKDHLEEEEFKGESRQSVVLHTHGKFKAKKIALLGLGPQNQFNEETHRRAAGSCVKLARSSKAQHVAISLPLKTGADAQAMFEGLFLASYRFDRYKQTDKKKKSRKIKTITVISSKLTPAQLVSAEERAEVFARATDYARDLVNTPAKDMSPKHMAGEAERLATLSPRRLKVKVMDRAELKRMGAGGILAVAQGSEHEPYLVHLTYRPPQKAKKRLVLVGKGVTFDSGGLSLKPSQGMQDMKIDMGGAAAVYGVFHALAALRPNVEVHGIAGLVENMPSGKAIRPGDIVKSMSGKTIEILNTDAEGRVTLADTLYYGAKLKPDAMIDLATLTGACMVALGQDIAGMMTDDDKLAGRLETASEASGEKLWRLPLVPEYAEQVKSKHADLKNITAGRYGGAITAGLFLKEFVGDTAWAHLDIAGPSYAEKETLSYDTWGATGYGVRTLLHFIKKF